MMRLKRCPLWRSLRLGEVGGQPREQIYFPHPARNGYALLPITVLRVEKQLHWGTNYIGVRTWSYFPLNIRWNKQPSGTFDDIVKDLKKHYVFRYDKNRLPVPDEVVKAACMKNLCQSVKKWRNKLKKKYDKKNEEEKKICGDQRLTQEEWDLLVKYWESEEVIESCKRNKVNCSHAQATHTLGSKSIARHYAEERKRLGDDFTVIGSYLSAHRKKDGTYHNTYTEEKCVEVEKIFHENQLQSSKDITDLPPVLDTVFGRHHGGFERGMGSGWSRRSHQYSGTSDARVEALSTQIQEKDKEMAEKIEQLKEAQKEEIRTLEAKMQAQLQAQAKRFMDVMKGCCKLDFGGGILVKAVWWRLFGGGLVEAIWWRLFGGGWLVEAVWWRLFGGGCLVEAVWWRLFGGGYSVEAVRWMLFGGGFGGFWCGTIRNLVL